MAADPDSPPDPAYGSTPRGIGHHLGQSQANRRSLSFVRRMFTALVIAVIVIVTLALVGTSLPEGNPLRDASEGLRSIGSSIADGFGGGYGQLLSG